MKALLPNACALGALALLLGCGQVPEPPEEGKPEPRGPSIKLKDESGAAVEVVGLAAPDLEALGRAKLAPEQWTALFAVYVDRGDGADRKDQPPLLGTYKVEKDVLRFEPRFPLARGVRYRAVFDATRLPGRDGADEKPVEAALLIPKPKTSPTVVRQVYPTRDDLPENQLKFYLVFSAPMSRGEAYKNVQLLKADGKPVEVPFLELKQELWNPNCTRFTLLFDPGRVKRGLASREEAGPVLEEGKTYTLVVSREWTDANGEPLKETFKKTFRALAPDDRLPDPKKWKLEAPAAGAAEALTVTFEKSLDYALLQRLLWVEDEKGRRVEGTVALGEKEASWRFRPKDAWRAGKYNLVVDTGLEDLAANTLVQPFEIDKFDKVERGVKSETVKVAFEVK
jgi:hypothetical protein